MQKTTDIAVVVQASGFNDFKIVLFVFFVVTIMEINLEHFDL